MKNSIGNSVILTLFGESHQEYIGGVLDGLTPGIKVDEDFIKEMLLKRRPSLTSDTSRVEEDNFKIISGVFNGYTDGSPLTILISNQNTKSNDYNPDIPRPSHSDYVLNMRNDGYNDYRGGGHFSGRITAPIVALGAICIKALEEKGIKIATHISRCGKFIDDNFSNYEKDIKAINSKNIPIISSKEEDFLKEVEEAKNKGDSIGGVTQTVVTGLPLGIGEPWFSSIDGVIANAMLSIRGVKGIEFGDGFDFANGFGSSKNDALYYDDLGEVKTKTNHSGGVNGGYTNGMPLIYNLAIKPTPSIALEQDTINLKTKENIKYSVHGRHDPAIIRRICPVISSLLAIVLCDLLESHFGVNYFKK